MFDFEGLMKNFELSPDCILEKSAKVIVAELIKGSLVVGCDYRNKMLNNVSTDVVYDKYGGSTVLA